MTKRLKIGTEFIKHLAASRFPNDKKKQEEFGNSPPKTIEFESNNEFFALTALLHKDAAIARLQCIESRNKEILSAAGDPRHKIVGKIIPLLKLAFRKIDHGEDYGFYVSEIERLCSKANTAILKPWADYAVKTKSGRVAGGRNSHGLSEGEQQKRNHEIQKEINRLCLTMSYNSSVEQLSRNWTVEGFDSVKKTTIKRVTKNPAKK